MRYEIKTEHVRQHTLSGGTVKCFNTQHGGSDWRARPGDWITYVENAGMDGSCYRTGRMLGKVYAPAIPDERYPCEEIKGYLSILALSDDLSHAYIRWIAKAHILGRGC